MPTILLVRHAQASFGTADYDVLSDTGHRQVEALAAALHDRGLRAARVVSGDLRRQLDTAAAWTAVDGSEVAVDPRWNEYDTAGMLSAHSASTARMEHPPDAGAAVRVSSREFQGVLDEAMDAWIAAGAGAGGPAAETWPAFRTRVTDALAEVAGTLGRGETALVCTSGGPVAACCVAALGLPDEAFPAFNRVTVNTGVTKLVSGRRGTTLVSFNEHSHLEAAGLVSYR